MRLRTQLFLTLLLASLLLIALMAGFNSWSFNRGFSEYIVKNEKRRLSPVLDQLGVVFEVNQGWDWLDNDPRKIHDILRAYGRVGPPPDSRNPTPHMLADNLDSVPSESGDNRKPDDARKPGGSRKPDDARKPGGSRKPGDTRSGPNNRPGPKLLIRDENMHLILGSEQPLYKVIWLPITSNDNTVGYWGIREPKGITGELEQVFSDQQMRSYIYAAVAMILLSMLLANALASRIVKPILKINKAVKHITAGEYQHRIDARNRDEIGDLSKNINQMALTLEKNLNTRQQWTAEISHELRTPVAVLQGELEAIQDGVNPLDQSAITSLHAESVRLSRLINDLHELSLSDLGALNYRMEPVDIASLVRLRLQDSKPLTSQHDLKVSLNFASTPVLIRGDAQRLEQLIDNLLQNSLRYTDEGGAIDIQIKQHSDFVVLDWADSHPGVTDEQLPQLFDSLYRVDQSRNRDSGGSGLGLTIVEKIVEAHAGEIEAYHSASGGLGVRVQLPI